MFLVAIIYRRGMDFYTPSAGLPKPPRLPSPGLHILCASKYQIEAHIFLLTVFFVFSPFPRDPQTGQGPWAEASGTIP